MNTNNIIDEYINREKEVSFSPSLQSRIMGQIEKEKVSQKLTLWQTIAVAASVIFVVISGTLIGNSYNPSSQDSQKITINDSQIENFLILTEDERE